MSLSMRSINRNWCKLNSQVPLFWYPKRGLTEASSFPLRYFWENKQTPEYAAFKWLTVYDGERIAVWNATGKLKIVDGPAKTLLFRSHYRVLERFTAEPSEFLRAVYKSGEKKYFYGPASLWEDPVDLVNVQVMEAITVDSNEAVVIYQQTERTIHRKIIQGPGVHMPSTTNEWIHEFRWHGSSSNNPAFKEPSALRFTKIRLMPDQMYYDVPNVRTKDDAVVVVQLMIFFKIVNLEQLLDNTHDPIADFINGVSADVVEFSSALLFEEFKNHTDELNKLETYKQLCSRAEGIGYKIDKVVFRGYQAPHSLQAMHDAAIERRTALRLESETETQAQNLEDFKLQKEYERAEKNRNLEKEKLVHQQQMESMKHQQTLSRKLEEHKQALLQQKETTDLDIEFNRKLAELGVDLTKILVAQQTRPEKLVQITGGSDSPRVHLHNKD